MQKCRDCGLEKPLTEYYIRKNRSGTSNHYTWCKDCNRIRDQLPQNRFARLRAECRSFNMPFTLPKADFIAMCGQPCHYCGEPVVATSGAGMDRLDRTKGYELGNVVPACWLCNSSKGTTFDEYEQKILSAHYKAFRERRAKLGLPPLEAPRKNNQRTPKNFASEGRSKRNWGYFDRAAGKK